MLVTYTEDELYKLISQQIEENLQLDYKASDALKNTDQKKKEISKDISAFANSNGGLIIYGIKEFDEQSKRHLPERLDPIDRNLISKEWLEQIINSNVQPKIKGIVITPIPIDGSLNQTVYAVSIPKSNTAHQANDKRYYKRYNFESIAMEDYEIRDILNRQANPELEWILDSSFVKFNNSQEASFPLIISNKSIRVAKDVVMLFKILTKENVDLLSTDNLQDISNLNTGKNIYRSKSLMTVYKGLNLHCSMVSLKLFASQASLEFRLSIFADNMEPTHDEIKMLINKQNVSFKEIR